MVDRLLLVTKTHARWFPTGLEVFNMVALLAERCGELAAEVQRWEGGRKVEKLGCPDRAQLAREIMDVLTCAPTIAEHHEHLEHLEDLSSRIEPSISPAVLDGFVTTEESGRA
jgi:NTP pyrophosphatase (non-canonical NTP hydrolase)